MTDQFILRFFVILRDLGCVPEKKGPFANHQTAIKFIREVIACRSPTTQITVASLTPNHDLIVNDGREAIEMIDGLLTAARKRAVRRRRLS